VRADRRYRARRDVGRGRLALRPVHAAVKHSQRYSTEGEWPCDEHHSAPGVWEYWWGLEPWVMTTDSTGTVVHFDLFIAPDGREVTSVQTDPGIVWAASERRGSRKKVSD
jgi:hypothetical protein